MPQDMPATRQGYSGNMLRWNGSELSIPETGQAPTMSDLAQPAHLRDLRSEFEKDYHRIIGSSAFRRLQDKTQVFATGQKRFHPHQADPFFGGVFLCQISGTEYWRMYYEPGLGCWLHKKRCKGISGDILQCAGLIHDIGNPPFGHFGEGSDPGLVRQEAGKSVL